MENKTLFYSLRLLDVEDELVAEKRLVWKQWRQAYTLATQGKIDRTLLLSIIDRMNMLDRIAINTGMRRTLDVRGNRNAKKPAATNRA